MRLFSVFFLALIASGSAHAADVAPLRGVQWAHTTRAYCASVAPAPCVPNLTILVYSAAPDLGFRVVVTYKHSDASVDTKTLYADRKADLSRGAFQGATVTYDPCGLDSGDITVQAVEVTPVVANGPTLKSLENGRIYLE